MMLYRFFRQKKYGEPLYGVKQVDEDEVEDYDQYNKEDAALIAQIKMAVQAKPIDYGKLGIKKQESQDNNISDLESIKEDDEESDDQFPSKGFKTK